MQTRVLVAAVVAFIALLPISGAAQSPAVEVTFQVPLNLTRLEPDITRVRVSCTIASRALNFLARDDNNRRGQVEIPVTGGEVRTTATVVVAIPAGVLQHPETEGADYECSIAGFSVGSRGTDEGWDLFNANQAKLSFRITPTPANLVGKFPWLEDRPL